MKIVLKETDETREEIKELISTQPTCMSEYQIEHFVIGDKMTNYRIIKQILMELDTRYVNFETMKIDKELVALELEELEFEHAELSEGFPKRKIGFLIQKKEIEIAALLKTFDNYIFELNILENNLMKMKAALGDLAPILNDKDGEEIYWVNKFVKEAQIDIMVSGRIGKGVLDAIMALPERLQEVIVQTAIGQATGSNAYMNAVEHKVHETMKGEKITLSLNNIVGPASQPTIQG